MAVDNKSTLSVFIVSANKTLEHYTLKCHLLLFWPFLAITR